jgi:hypothetical protein
MSAPLVTLSGDALHTYKQLLVSGISSDPDAQKQKVTQLVHMIHNQLESHDAHARLRVQGAVRQSLSREDLSALFFDVLGMLPEQIFNRGIIRKNSALEKVLVKAWQERMHEMRPNLIDARQECERTLADPTSTKAQVGQKLLELVEKEALFALSLGVRPKSAGATSTAFFLRDLEGKKIAIFKPDSLGPAGKENPKLLAKIARFFYKKVLRLTGIRQSRQRVGEAFCYRMSASLGHFTAPPTKILETQAFLTPHDGVKAFFLLPKVKGAPNPETQRGSLQVLIDGVVPARNVLPGGAPSKVRLLFGVCSRLIKNLIFPDRPLLRAKQPPHPHFSDPSLPPKIFLGFALFDFITGQIDRHLENWMLPVAQPQKKSARIEVSAQRLFSAAENGSYIVSIDNGASAPVGYPSELETFHQYVWAKLPMADIAVSALARELPLEPGWRHNIIRYFLDVALPEDLREMPQHIQDKHAQISALMHQCTQSILHPIPQEQLRSLLQNGLKDIFGSTHIPPKLLRQLTKIALQMLAMKERIAVIDCFLAPPKGYEARFTLKTLAKIRTKNDYARFWRDYYLLIQKAAT